MKQGRRCSDRISCSFQLEINIEILVGAHWVHMSEWSDSIRTQLEVFIPHASVYLTLQLHLLPPLASANGSEEQKPSSSTTCRFCAGPRCESTILLRIILQF